MIPVEGVIDPEMLWGLLGLVTWPAALVTLFGPAMIVDAAPAEALPDPATGFRRSDALPLGPVRWIRYLAFLYASHAPALARPGRRWRFAVLRWATPISLVAFLGISVLWVAESSGLRFDPDADILKSDIQRSAEAAAALSASPE